MTLGAWLRGGWTRMAGRPAPFILGESRLTVLDIDVTGIDAHRDRALGIAVLPLAGSAFRPAELAYCRLPATPAPGAAGRACYQALLDAVGDDPVITFNPAFVRHMLERTLVALELPLPRCRWVDLGLMLEGAFGREAAQADSLQAWQQRLGLTSIREHAAVADVFAMAQMFQMLLAYCEEAGLRTLGDLLRAQKSRAWLRGD